MTLRQQDQAISVQKIGRYEIISQLGQGAMGVVYKANDPNIGRVVALKSMRLDVYGSEHDLMAQRFRNEARAVGLLNHPNIVTVFDAGEADGIFYIAMEYIEGRTLASMLLENSVIDNSSLVEIGSQICSGLHYAHTYNVIHRDIKPANIMVSATTGRVKIMDFGIAKTGSNLTRVGEVIGTPHYMSPEQVKGLELDGRSDIFSMGVLLYEMVSGIKPFDGETTAIIYKIVNEDACLPREMDGMLHPGLSHVIAKCLSKDPNQRYQDANELAAALKSYESIPVAETRGLAQPQMSSAATLVTTPAQPITASKGVSRSRTTPTNTMVALASNLPVHQEPQSPKGASSRHGFLLFTVLAVVLAFVALSIRTRKYQAQQQAPSRPAGSTTQTAGNTPITTETKDGSPILKPSSAVRDTQRPQVPKPALNTTKAKPERASASTKVQSPAHRETSKDPLATGTNSVFFISSTPAGADIAIDGSPSGLRTPAHIPVKAGTHHVVLHMEGFQPEESTTNSVPGELVKLAPHLQVRSTPEGSSPANQEVQGAAAVGRFRRFLGGNDIPAGKGVVQIKTKPKGATVIVSGVKIGRPTPVRFPFAPGSYTVTIQKPGFAAVTRPVIVEEGKQVDLDESMIPEQH